MDNDKDSGKPTFVSISVHGKVKTFNGDFDIKGQNVKVERISHILPEHPILRFAFKLIRSVVSDESVAATWTRKWKCTWYVHIIPTNEKFYGFRDRDEAILFERKHIIELVKKGIIK